MSQNGISTLSTKAARKAAKLALAAAKRATVNTPGYRPLHFLTSPLTVSPVVGHPWKTTATIIPFTLTERIDTNGQSIVETNVGPLILAAKSSSYQVFPPEDGYIKVNGNTIKTLNLANTSRGHTLAVISPAGATVGSITTYDTYGTSGSTAALTSALTSVATGNYIVLVSWDACAVDTGMRAILRTGFGATLNTTWNPTRYSHIFIGKKS